MPDAKHLCPNCHTSLDGLKTRQGIMWSCPKCNGRAMGVGLMQIISEPKVIQQIWIKAKAENRVEGKPCPCCQRRMLTVTTSPQLGAIEVDICATCYFIWFDTHEIEKIPRATAAEIEARTPKSAPGLPPLPKSNSANASFNYDEDELTADLIDLILSWTLY